MMNNFPKVSISIPTYRQAHCISRAIESALTQDYPNLEIIVADDCSPDDTGEVVKKYTHDPRFKYYRNESNIGRVKNYKKCLEEYATGEWVVNCDGDDYYIDNSFVSELIAAIFQHQDKSVVFAQGGKIKHYSDHEEYSLPKIQEPMIIMNGKEYFLETQAHDFFAHVSTIYRRDIAKSIDFYRCDILSTDRESFLRLALHGDVILLKKAYAKWVAHDDNFSRKTDIEVIMKNRRYIENCYEYAKFHGLNQQQLEEWHQAITQNFYVGWMKRIVLNNASIWVRITLLQKLFFQIVKHQPAYLLNKRIWVYLIKEHMKAFVR